MIVRQLDDCIGTDREVEAPNGNWISRRLILAKDDMGFSLHDTVIRAHTETLIWYQHHLEAVYCISGCGELEELDSGTVHPITPGMMYALSGNERHHLRAFDEDMRMVCVFNPALSGEEVHNEEGVYPPAE